MAFFFIYSQIHFSTKCASFVEKIRDVRKLLLITIEFVNSCESVLCEIIDDTLTSTAAMCFKNYTENGRVSALSFCFSTVEGKLHSRAGGVKQIAAKSFINNSRPSR